MTAPDIVDMARVVADRLWRRDLAAGRTAGPTPSADDLDDADDIVRLLVDRVRADIADDVRDALTRASYITWSATQTPEERLFQSAADACAAMVAFRLGIPHV